jgi:hypothetical protein
LRHAVSVENQTVRLELADGSTHSFPILYYPRLAQASPELLGKVVLRVGGRALRWDSLDEDIWIADAVNQNYPSTSQFAVAEDAASYPVNGGAG